MMKRLLLTLCLLLSAARANADAWSSLSLWYELNNAYTDSSGGGLTATAINTPTFTTGQIGTHALTLNGTSQYATRVFTMPATGSVTWWQNPARAHNSGVAEVSFAYGNSSNTLSFQHFSDNSLYVGFLNGPDYRIILAASAGNYTQNTWQHYAITWTSGGTTTLYRNGVSIGTAGSTTTTLAAGGNLRLASYTDVGGTYFSGSLDDFRVYSRALSSGDVNEIYNWRRPVPLFYYHAVSSKFLKLNPLLAAVQ